MKLQCPYILLMKYLSVWQNFSEVDVLWFIFIPRRLRTLYYWRKLSVFLPQILTNIPKILAKEHLFLNAYTVLPFYFKRFTVTFSLRILPVCDCLYCYCSSDMICDQYSADPGGCRIAGSFCCLITRSCRILLWPQGL